METKQKIKAVKELKPIVEQCKKNNRVVVTVNGSFDLLHAGHLAILEAAKKQGDILIVALNSDLSIQGYKSPDRPIVPLRYRLELIAALEVVDYVTFFDELNPIKLLEQIKPSVHVNGIEYQDSSVEEKTVLEYGGKCVYVPRVDGLSTSAIVEKIQALCV